LKKRSSPAVGYCRAELGAIMAAVRKSVRDCPQCVDSAFLCGVEFFFPNSTMPVVALTYLTRSLGTELKRVAAWWWWWEDEDRFLLRKSWGMENQTMDGDQRFIDSLSPSLT